jgi:hypothetical protein
MANSKYDHTSTIMSGSEWPAARIMAYLFEGAVYDKAHKTLDEVRTGATQRNATEIQNRSMGENGECKGLPAVFSVTPKGDPYQVVLAWDHGTSVMDVLAFYDEDEASEPLGLQNNGTFIVRPTDVDPVTLVGTWFSL